jgi:protein-disulfide isomerase
MNQRLEMALTLAIGAAAMSTAAVAIHREFFSSPAAIAPAAGKTTYLDGWKDLVSQGHLIGLPSAPVKVIEFADVECPFCRGFNAAFDSVKAQLGDSIALVFIHFPIPGHRFAIPGARALECAAAESRVGQLVDLFYQKQDSLGLKSWASYGREAGVKDTAAFARCAASAAPVKAAAEGTDLGHKLGVHGTPTVYVNGWRFGSPPSTRELRQMADEVRAGKRPSAATP